MQFEKHHDFYKDIGMDLDGRKPEEVDIGELKAAFRATMKRFHPDKVRQLPDEERKAAEATARAASLAKEVLIDKPELRDSYHYFLRTGMQPHLGAFDAAYQHAADSTIDDIFRDFEKMMRDFEATMRESDAFLAEHEMFMQQFEKAEHRENVATVITLGIIACVAAGAGVYNHVMKTEKNKRAPTWKQTVAATQTQAAPVAQR